MLDEYMYNRQAAVEYAQKWANGRNPAFYDFSKLGGDCTNFASQCLLAGAPVMNYTPTFGWYYRSASSRSPSWTGVQYLFNFLTANKGAGPFGAETSIDAMEPGDLVQFSVNNGAYHHTPVIVEVLSGPPALKNILVAAHSYDTDRRPLSSYDIRKIRFIHIEGFRAKAGSVNALSQKEPESKQPFLHLPVPVTLV